MTCPREKLYAIIDRRVDRMFESGLIDEVRGLRERYPDSLRAFQAIGYKEVIEGLKTGEDEATMRETIKGIQDDTRKGNIPTFRIKWKSTGSSRRKKRWILR